ncbi:MAG TPA: GWxTD domain-containing protein [Gemmatimonadales bacterium]|jgi:GWxTD domain-containing protein
MLGLLAVVVCCPASLRAQSRADRDAVFQFRDSLATATDSVSLLALEARYLDDARKNRDDPLPKFRLGYTGLRLAQVTGAASHFRDAESEFEWITQLQPKWPLGWYALGNAELNEADVFPAGIRGLFATLGHDIFVQPAHDIARSGEVDSLFTIGLTQIGEDALDHNIGSHLDAALAALREVAASPVGRQRDVLLMRGMVEREHGDIDSAITAFAAIVRRNGDDARAQLELGRTQLMAGRIVGTGPWYAGLAQADSSVAALYHSDLALVMSDSALGVFDRLRGAARVADVREFWDTRDPESLNTSAERLREHYRRLEFAHRNYRLLAPAHRYDSVRTFAATGSRFDDRGRIYVRHGEPDDRSSLTMIGLPPNETWLYRRPAGDLIFNFAQPDSAQGYRIYESILDIVGLGAAAQHTGQGDVATRLAAGNVVETYGAAWTAQAAQELLYSRQKMSPVYAKMLSAGPGDAQKLQSTERVEGRRSMAIGLQTDSWTFGYELPLVADVDVVAFGGTPRQPEVQVAYAIPGSSLYATPTGGPLVYPIRVRAAVRNARNELVAFIDTTRNYTSSAPIPEQAHLLGRVPLAVPPGDYTVRVAVETANRGIVEPPRTIHVAPLAAAQVTLTDLALGVRSVPLSMRSGAADTAWFNPLHRFAGSEPLQLTFEVGGLAPGAAYRTQIAIFRSGHKSAAIQVAGNATTSTAPERVHRQVDLSRLGSGSYEIEVTISTPDGVKVSRRHEFSIGGH